MDHRFRLAVDVVVAMVCSYLETQVVEGEILMMACGLPKNCDSLSFVHLCNVFPIFTLLSP